MAKQVLTIPLTAVSVSAVSGAIQEVVATINPLIPDGYYVDVDYIQLTVAYGNVSVAGAMNHGPSLEVQESGYSPVNAGIVGYDTAMAVTAGTHYVSNAGAGLKNEVVLVPIEGRSQTVSGIEVRYTATGKLASAASTFDVFVNGVMVYELKKLTASVALGLVK